MHRAIVLVVAACHGARARHDNPPAPPADTVTLPATGPFTLPAAWTACTSDADCAVVSLGCCNNTAVNRGHAGDTRQALEVAGRRECPVKAACGPGPGGTWDGEAGTCARGTCALPSGADPNP